MSERLRPLRMPPPETRRHRLARRLAAPRRPFGWALQAIGRADQRALVALRTRGHSALGVRTAQGLGHFGEMGSGWAGLAILGALARPERQRAFLAAAAAAPVAIIANYSVKLTIGRRRPLIDDHPPLGRAPSKLSFPSAHSTSSVAGAVALGRVTPKARPALYALAGAVCLGRPYLGMHYPSDVVAGAALGYAIGRLHPLPETGTQPADPAAGMSPGPERTGRGAEDPVGGNP